MNAAAPGQQGSQIPEEEPELESPLFDLVDLIPVGAGITVVQRGISQAAMTASRALSKALTLSEHVVGRLAGREVHVTEDMIEVALRKGTRFWDPKNLTEQYILEGGMASGKTLLVARNPVTGVITTTITGPTKRVIRPRFVPFP